MALLGRKLNIKKNGEWIASSVACTIDTGADTLETSAPTDGEWKNFLAGRKNWSVQVAWLCTREERIAQNLLLVGKTVTLDIYYSAFCKLSGRAICTRAKITGQKANLLNGSFEFRGTGALTTDGVPTGDDDDEQTGGGAGSGSGGNFDEAYLWQLLGTTIAERVISESHLPRHKTIHGQALLGEGDIKLDTFNYTPNFLAGLLFGDYGISGGGIARLAKIYAEHGITAPTFRTPDYSGDGLMGTGSKLDGEGLVVDSLTVRKDAFFNRVVVRETAGLAGNQLICSAASKIERVEWIDGDGTVIRTEYQDGASTGGDFATALADVAVWRCHWTADNGTTLTTNSWWAGMQALCETFNIERGVHENVSNRYYWRLVSAVGDDYVEFRAKDVYDDGSADDGGLWNRDSRSFNTSRNNIPTPGDTIVHKGFRMMSTGSYAPWMRSLTGFKMECANNSAGDDFIAPCTLVYNGVGVPDHDLYGNDIYGTWWSLGGNRCTWKQSLDGVVARAERFFFETSDYYRFPLFQETVAWEEPATQVNFMQDCTFDSCTWKCVAPGGTDECPIVFEDGEYKLNPKYKLLSGTPTLLQSLDIVLGFVEADPVLGEGKPLKYCFSLWRGWTSQITEDVSWRIYRAIPSADTSNPEYYEGFVPNHSDTWNTAPSNPSDESDVKTRIAMKRTAFSNGGRCIVQRFGSDFEIHDVEETVNKGEIWMEVSDLERNGVDYIDTKFLIYAALGNGEQAIYLT